MFSFSCLNNSPCPKRVDFSFLVGVEEEGDGHAKYSGVIPVFRGSNMLRTKQMTEMRPGGMNGGRKGLLDSDLSQSGPLRASQCLSCM